MDKLLEPGFWVTSWKTFSSAPEIAIPLLILVGVVEQLTVVKKNEETLRAEVAALKKKIPKGARHNELATSVVAVTNTMTKLSAANERLQRTITGYPPRVVISGPVESNAGL